ncbi:MAG: translation initiation factor [Salinivirgaceae bacterium]|nr:translation initiation factor [Salinivirgaceae bacterium]
MAKKEKQDWKDRLNVVYSTNPDYNYDRDKEEEDETLDATKQKLKVSIDRKKRKGKSVTLVEGFIGTEDDLKELAKFLKTKCGVGGSAKDGEIIIQGEFKQKVADILQNLGYKTKLVGG